MYFNLRSAMAKESVTIDRLSEILGVHRNTVANKINGDTPFTYDEVLTICDVCFQTYNQSWLFKKFKKELQNTG